MCPEPADDTARAFLIDFWERRADGEWRVMDDNGVPRFAEDGNWRTGLAEQAHYYAWQVTGADIARQWPAIVGSELSITG